MFDLVDEALAFHRPLLTAVTAVLCGLVSEGSGVTEVSGDEVSVVGSLLKF